MPIVIRPRCQTQSTWWAVSEELERPERIFCENFRNA